MNKFLPYNKIIIAGHRGLKALYPENTRVSFLVAIEAGVDMIETDLRLTKDGEIVIMHDRTVDRTTNGSGTVKKKASTKSKVWMQVLHSAVNSRVNPFLHWMNSVNWCPVKIFC